MTEDTQEIHIPTGIINYLQKRSGLNGQITKSRYTVTDIVSCQRKTYYKALGIREEELLQASMVESMWDMIRGDYLHQLTYAYKWRELDVEYKILLKDGRTAVLAGRLDMYDWKEKTIMDLKTSKYIE
jgi:hypothetical protein